MAKADLTLGEAAKAIGVSVDTLRRWERAGKLRAIRDDRNRRLIPKREVARLARGPQRHRAGDSLSARNRFSGRVVSVESDGVMALVEIEAGPPPATPALTPDAGGQPGAPPRGEAPPPPQAATPEGGGG